MEDLSEYKSGKKYSLRELQIMHALANSLITPKESADEMILVYFEEDFMDECIKKNLILIIDEINEELKMMKVMMNKFLAPIIKKETKNTAKEVLEWAKHVHKETSQVRDNMLDNYVDKEIRNTGFEVLIG